MYVTAAEVGCRENDASSRLSALHRKVTFPLPRRVNVLPTLSCTTRSQNSASEGDVAASQFEPEAASRRSQCVPGIEPRE
eukprot:4540125-Prymnesium_polylepis.1